MAVIELRQTVRSDAAFAGKMIGRTGGHLAPRLTCTLRGLTDVVDVRSGKQAFYFLGLLRVLTATLGITASIRTKSRFVQRVTALGLNAAIRS